MKITKQRLVEIIKEELASVTEVHSKEQRNYMCSMADEGADRPKGLSQDEAEEMCTGPMKEEEDPDMDFEKDQAHSDGVSDGSIGAPHDDGYGPLFQRFYDAGYNLGVKKSQEDALVLPDAGTAGVVKSRQALKRAMDLKRRQKKLLRYKN